ncbi:MAG TPA: 50S ribosomal protein L13 [Candidatus Omnitrophota bacterium]|nr:50S ribosomal protein L13 [Candidatus Omnitrophota bacterium]
MKKKTYSVKPKEIKREKFVVNADSQVLGRLASAVAEVLMGKNKPIFSRHIDCGDYVTVFNAEKIRLTGNKEKSKTYFSHSLYPRGDKLLKFEEKKRRDPRKIIYLAVKGMVPRTTLGEMMLKKLKIYQGEVSEAGKALTI